MFESRGLAEILLSVFPLVLLFELPAYLLCWLGVISYALRRKARPQLDAFRPRVSCVVTCYSEGRDVGKTVETLIEQTYPGVIEILIMVDGAVQNRATYLAAREWQEAARRHPSRILKILPKRTRGGRVSSLNAGRHFATGEVVLALDGDTSFDNDMVWQITRPFADPQVAGVSGALRVRNAAASLVARLQALEYMLTIQLARTGLTTFNTVNNISGAFGAFRGSLLDSLGGWDAGTAEDLDLTLRIKKRFGPGERYRIVHQPLAMGHTDAPTEWKVFFKQRLRWDGDLFYLYVRKHWHSLRPGLLGWRNFIMLMWTGVYFQLVMPFIIVGATLWLVWSLPWPVLLAVLGLTYLFYTLLTGTLFLSYLLLLSERRRQDWPYLAFVPLFPFFTFASRVWNAFATLAELVTRQHLDSSMAPWWVLRKTRY
ncbi:glycosyltransferase [Uliginosibacterium sp. 31-12]|uniref:glycosyltransferase family 2 protein n=1 Tax=Uliginosibacterium sp. 31-12 TaxID=3062781 RepID=UPI0026E3EF84|nr:glycosyltransferase [Uliginosibacterium sp. 31-12]MDO6386571.1 glycosyltransferase [Uliginosibacterium sp. 31-12]